MPARGQGPKSRLARRHDATMSAPWNGDRARLLRLLMRALEPGGMESLTPEERDELAAFAKQLVEDEQEK